MKKIFLTLLFTSILFAKTSSILFLGDSLTEGYGLQKEEAYPAQVQNLIKTHLNKDIKVINGGVSGSTTSDGLARLKWYLRAKPSIIFIALGANDGLRGLNLEKSQESLEKIIETAQKSGAKVMLAGMLIPPNYGQEYANKFEAMFVTLQKKYSLKTMPFLLKDVAGVKEFNQRDGIHPNKQGQKIVALNVYEFLKEDL